MTMKKACLDCGKPTKRTAQLYCSNRCQQEFQYKAYVEKWKKGIVDGNRGIRTRNISNHIYRYLKMKHDNACQMCGWNEIHPATLEPPLEIDHIDGNAENNKEENLQLLCPNCHSLTANFRNRNYGNGRAWRRRYVKRD